MGELVDLLESSWENWVDLNVPFKRPEKGLAPMPIFMLNGFSFTSQESAPITFREIEDWYFGDE